MNTAFPAWDFEKVQGIQVIQTFSKPHAGFVKLKRFRVK